jgi:glycine cleavage system H protein
VSDIPAGLKYTKDHEWARLVEPGSGGGASELVVGITKFAVEQLGDITLVNIDAKVGDTVTAGKAFGTIESVKTLSDLFAPVNGKLTKVNRDLESKPELVNEDCYGKGWMIAIAPTEPKAVNALMDDKAYGDVVKAAAH